MGLTTDEPGAEPGEPDKYYPSGERTYARIVPKDTIQGAALATLMKEDGCTKVQVLNDKEVYGAGLSRNIENSAKEQGLEITSNEAIDKNAANYRSLASKAKGAGADWDRIIFKGLTVQGIYGRKMYETWYKMTQLVLSGFPLGKVLTHQLPIDEFQQGFDLMEQGKEGKVVLSWT